jgi:hypothetical protein
MQLADGMMADMHSADVALTYARDYAAPTGGCLTFAMPASARGVCLLCLGTDKRRRIGGRRSLGERDRDLWRTLRLRGRGCGRSSSDSPLLPSTDPKLPLAQ